MPELQTTCCIAGGGPAGMMLGLLLARAGVGTVVLEKHADFLRDFRGDTIHPSTLELMHELGRLEAFLALPHNKAHHLNAQFGERRLRVADSTHLPVQAPFVAFMPQWDFLDFLADEAAQNPSFTLAMQTEVTDVVERDGRVVGVRARGPEGDHEVHAHRVVAADGHGSTVRDRAGLEVRTLGGPMDVLWFRLPRQDGDPEEPAGSFAVGRILIMINRGTHWQCGYVIAKGSLDALKARGLPALRAQIGELAAFVADRLDAIANWNDVKLLTVAVNRLERWHRPGMLAIGDAAHAMSPVGGVGVNLAIQDAVATADLRAGRLAAGEVTEADLAAVQRRRAWPTRLIQRLQIAVQNRIIRNVLAGDGTRVRRCHCASSPVRRPFSAFPRGSSVSACDRSTSGRPLTHESGGGEVRFERPGWIEDRRTAASRRRGIRNSPGGRSSYSCPARSMLAFRATRSTSTIVHEARSQRIAPARFSRPRARVTASRCVLSRAAMSACVGGASM